jgi:hypothetical protein
MTTGATILDDIGASDELPSYETAVAGCARYADVFNERWILMCI